MFCNRRINSIKRHAIGEHNELEWAVPKTKNKEAMNWSAALIETKDYKMRPRWMQQGVKLNTNARKEWRM